MSANEPNEPFDLSRIPDAESSDSASPTPRPAMDLSETEPLTEAAAENLADLPELPDQVEMKPTRSSKPVPVDDLPDLPSDAQSIAAQNSKTASPTPPKPPAAKAPQTKAPRKPAAPKAPEKPKAEPKAKVAPKPIPKPAEAAPPKPVAPQAKAKPVVVKPKAAAKPIQKVTKRSGTPAQAEAESETSDAATPEAGAASPASIEPMTSDASSAPTPEAAGAAVPPVDRKPDLTPIHLRKAAWIVLLGSLLPWMGSGAGWVTFVAVKATICLGAWILFQTVRLGAGEKVPDLIAKLGAIRWAKPDSGKRNKPFSEQLLGTIPSLGHLVGLIALIGGVAVTLLDPSYDTSEGDLIKGLAEVGMLAWAAGTMVHIFAFTHGGKFNPLFPLMFIGMVFSGLLSLIGALGMENQLLMASSVLGSLAVASGGVFACYTIFEAMKQAKVEGEAKKLAAREARKAARGQAKGGKQTVGKPATVRKTSADKS